MLGGLAGLIEVGDAAYDLASDGADSQPRTLWLCDVGWILCIALGLRAVWGHDVRRPAAARLSALLLQVMTPAQPHGSPKWRGQSCGLASPGR